MPENTDLVHPARKELFVEGQVIEEGDPLLIQVLNTEVI